MVAHLVAVAAVGFLCITAPADVDVPVCVREPAGVARVHEPASGGVPFIKGQVKDVAQLTLLDSAGKPVPAQFTKLAGYEDGSVQWTLVDFLVSVEANGQADFRVQAGQPADPTAALKVVETDDQVQFDTGQLQFAVSKKSFVLLDKVKLNGKDLASTAGAEAAQLVAEDGTTCSAGAPSSVKFEYRGPLRATLRLDGHYIGKSGEPFIGYRTRITAWAGTSIVKIDHMLRNSPPQAGADIFLKQATLSMDIAAKGDATSGATWAAGPGVLASIRHSGGCFPGGSSYKSNPAATLYRQEVRGGRLTVFAIPPADTVPLVGAEPKEAPPATTQPARKRRYNPYAMFGYDKARGVFGLADMACKSTELMLEFFDGARPAESCEARSRALRSMPHAAPDPAWVSQTETLGVGRFGTIQDEIDTYRKWGWKEIENEKKRPNMPHDPAAYVAKESIHGTSECDCAEALVLLYLRTGQRGCLDWARAWAEFGANHYAYRTDGFAYAWKGGNRKSTTYQVGWYASPNNPLEVFGWADSRSEYCHFYGRGIIDYYCLTGDMEALEAAGDLMEEVDAYVARIYPKIGCDIGSFGVRGFARIWLAALRMAQLTRDPIDVKRADHMGELTLKARDLDPRGFVYWANAHQVMYQKMFNEKVIPARLKEYCQANGIAIDAKGNATRGNDTWQPRSDGGTWQQVTLNMAVERWYRLSGRDEAKALAIRQAEFARDYQFSKNCKFAYYYTTLDFPEKGKQYDEAEWTDLHPKNPDGSCGGKHSGHYSAFFPDVFARAYTLTGDKAWLDLGKMAWNAGSKRGFEATKMLCPDDEVGRFAQHVSPKDDDQLNTARLFYEVPRAKR